MDLMRLYFVGLRARLPLANAYFARLVQTHNIHPRGIPYL